MTPVRAAWVLILLAIVALATTVVREDPDPAFAAFTCVLVVGAGFGMAQVMLGMFQTWTKKEREPKPLTWPAAIIAPLFLGLTSIAVVVTDDPGLGRQALGYAGLFAGWIAGDIFRRDRYR